MTSRVLYSAQHHRQHCAFQAFEQYVALYMHNHDDKYSARPRFEPGTSMLQAPVDTNEPLRPIVAEKTKNILVNQHPRFKILSPPLLSGQGTLPSYASHMNRLDIRL